MKPTIDPDTRNGISPDDPLRPGRIWLETVHSDGTITRTPGWLWHDDHNVHMDSLSREEALFAGYTEEQLDGDLDGDLS